MCTSHGRRLNARLKWEERINREKEGKIKKRKRETKVRRRRREEEREREGWEERECGRKAGRANERGTVYLATGGTYRSICAQPLSTQTAYVDT